MRRLASMTLIAVWLLTPGIRAQESASSGIVGQVVDSTRGAMPGATVTVINVGTNAQRVVNTDAEGRLVLADALAYARTFEPDLLVDNATLTGACVVALGNTCSGFYASNEETAEEFSGAVKDAGEQMWRMPLLEELKEQLKSDVADLKHTGDRWGGSITAALFLREFTQGVPWMHCDIPGPVLRDRASGMHPKGGTGHAVLTFLELVREHDQNRIVSASGQTTPRRARRSVRAAGTIPSAPVRRRRRKTT